MGVRAQVAARRRRWWKPPRAWSEPGDSVTADTPLGELLRGLRWGAILIFLLVLFRDLHRDGVPFARTDQLFWITIGLACACIGRRPVWLLWLLIDFLSFAAVLVVYDHLRGIADSVGMPTWWTPQIRIDRFLFFGQVPTVWLQEHLKHQRFSGALWYDLVVCITYYSFFFLPYVTAGVLWLRSRAEFYRWSLRFVGLSFLCFAFFVLIPTAPPWAAAQCSAADVANHPSDPSCMNGAGVAPDALLGTFTTHQPGANPWVERIAGDTFWNLHLGVAHTIWHEGALSADRVAAVPSLHLAGAVLFSIFMWSRLSRWWRPVLVGYPLVMMFSLAYAGEHYVTDGIAGALCAWLVCWLADQVEQGRFRRAGPAAAADPPSGPSATGADPHRLPAQRGPQQWPAGSDAETPITDGGSREP
jgi:membrane-associated phospholipid phosphatase